jgi:hypothetical protein
MEHVTETGLSPGESRCLQRIAGIMIPADDTYRVPGADDPAIFADIAATLGRDLPDVRRALAALSELAAGSFDQVDDARAEEIAMRLLSRRDAAALALGRVVLVAYYRDDRVVTALGREARPPFPKGHSLPEGDWSLLDAVKGRPRFWRDDRGG